MPKQTIMRTLRHGAGQARLTVLHASGTIDVIVAAEGADDPMTHEQIVEALRNATGAMVIIGSHIEQHIGEHGY